MLCEFSLVESMHASCFSLIRSYSVYTVRVEIEISIRCRDV